MRSKLATLRHNLVEGCTTLVGCLAVYTVIGVIAVVLRSYA